MVAPQKQPPRKAHKAAIPASNSFEPPNPRQIETTAGDSLSGPSVEVDLEAAQTFLRLLDPTAKAFHFRVVPEAPGSTGHARNVVGALDDVADELREANEAGCAVYVSTQAMKGGSAKADNLRRIRCCWLDFDARQGQKLPRVWKQCPPQIINESSPGSYHAWWLLSDEPDPETWRGIQRRLVQTFKADPSGATNTAKLLRLPGFQWRKREPAHLVQTVHCSHVRYSVAEMSAVYTPAFPKQQSAARPFNGGPVDLAVLQSALDHLAKTPHPNVKNSTTYSDDYEAWWSTGIALYRALGEAGFALWDDWSRGSRLYPGPEVSREKWATFQQADRNGDGIRLGTIYFRAKRNGWSQAGAMMRAQLATALEAYNKGNTERHG